MTDIDSADVEPELGDSDRGEDPTISDDPDPANSFTVTPIPDGLAESARAKVWQVLTADTAAEDLKMYYRTEGNYAGRTFLDAPPVVANEFTAADLFAVSLLQVSVHPRAARLFLDPGPDHDTLITLLTSIPPNLELAEAVESTYLMMARLYQRVKAILGKDPWVTASKVCARKRPRLFPVRDKRVRMLLGLYEYRNCTIDWRVFSHVMRQDDVVDRLAELKEDAESQRGDNVSLDAYPLRHLDVLLWMEARRRGVGGAVR
jgi:hypothetical protein